MTHTNICGMDRNKLISLIRQRRSCLCVGLDSDPAKIAAGVSVLEFNKRIIDATREYCVAYKPNTAFYECMGAKGWEILEQTLLYIGSDHFTIADAKRGDIGNTSDYYAKTFFETYPFDSVTVAPYMGKDSVAAFLNYKNKWAIILALTSNPGAEDFEMLPSGDGKIFEEVLKKSSFWGNSSNTMYVVGATRADMLADVRKIVPEHFLLVPGVGAQGGSMEEVFQYGANKDVGLLINASRSILYASNGNDFDMAARKEAKKMRDEMSQWMKI